MFQIKSICIFCQIPRSELSKMGCYYLQMWLGVENVSIYLTIGGTNIETEFICVCDKNWCLFTYRPMRIPSQSLILNFYFYFKNLGLFLMFSVWIFFGEIFTTDASLVVSERYIYLACSCNFSIFYHTVLFLLVSGLYSYLYTDSCYILLQW